MKNWKGGTVFFSDVTVFKNSYEWRLSILKECEVWNGFIKLQEVKIGWSVGGGVFYFSICLRLFSNYMLKLYAYS